MLFRSKRNTAPAILSSVLIKEIPESQPLIFLTSDHLIEKTKLFNKSIKQHQKYLTDKNILIFGIKPSNPSSEFGYFLSKRVRNKYKVTKFIEKPNLEKAKKIIKRNAYWNSGMFFLTKKSIINNFKKHQNKNFNHCLNAVNKSKYKNNIYHLDRKSTRLNSSHSQQSRMPSSA